MSTRANILTGVVGGAVILFVAGVFAASEWKMAREYSVPLAKPIENPNPDLAQGERMARIVGCWAGCHGTKGEGGTEEISGIRKITAPTLSEVIPAYSDAELARLILHGVKRNGKSAIGMSSYVFWHLGDTDLANIIHFLRQQPTVRAVPREYKIPFRSRIKLLAGEWKLSVDQVDHSQPRWGNLPLGTSFERGRYLAAIVCAECHGVDYQGDALEGAPSLALLAFYDEESFARLMKAGQAQSGRQIEPMSWLPGVRFTDQDVSDLYAFLRE
jgi:cytochrome c553